MRGATEVSEYEFTFIDATGKVVVSMKGPSGEPIDGSTLPPGIYILQVSNGLNSFRQKVSKK